MAIKIHSCSFTGLECRIIEVQADISNGMPQFSIVGLGDASVQESKERIRSSIKNSGAEFPQTRKTINLAPAQLKKQGSLFDLPIALSILLASKQIPQKQFDKTIIIGELSLDGQIKGVNGVLPITQHAKEQGFTKIILPSENAEEASFIDGIEICPMNNLKELIDLSFGRIRISQSPKSTTKKRLVTCVYPLQNLSAQIIGAEKAKRALAIAAAGHHNVLLNGSPGCGKTVLARYAKTLLTQMSKKEILETTKIFSVAGLLDGNEPIIYERPFREVHHTASTIAVIGGGGNNPKPGEISLAHNGVLFLDEIAEFTRFTLEALRQPLEDKSIHINRANFSAKFPCNFLLIATMNPCPCGHSNNPRTQCTCSEKQILNYKKKISGPLLDRIDLFVDVERAEIHKVFDPKTKERLEKEFTLTTESISTADKIQKSRFKFQKGVNKNSDMELKQIQEFCQLDKASNEVLINAINNLNLSNRGYLRTLKIARTIADMEGKEKINENHVTEALQYRR